MVQGFGFSMKMRGFTATYNESQCVCQKCVTLFVSLYGSSYNELQCVCQKFVTLFVLICVSFASCCNEFCDV
jgi:hypothetical protein